MPILTRSFLLTVLALGGAQAAFAALPLEPFPLGRAELGETRTSEALADGVTFHRVNRGYAESGSPWIVTAGVARDAASIAAMRACIRAVGEVPREERFETPGHHPTPYVEVIGGTFRNEAAAKAASQSGKGCKLGARAIAASPSQSDGPWRLSIVEIDPARYRGRLFSASGTGKVAGRTTTSEIARKTGALVAINGGFFAMTPEEGVVGEPAGLSVIAGRMRSEATLGRPYLLLRDGPRVSAQVMPEAAPWPAIVWSDGRRTQVSGINRQAGQVRDCGTTGAPANRAPAQDRTCFPVDDLVAITPESDFSPRTSGPATIATLRPDGRLVAGDERSAGGIALIGLGRMAQDLNERLETGATGRLDLTMPDPLGTSQPAGLHAISGAPLLLRNGRMVRHDDTEGWATHGVPAERLNYVHRWSILRNPRTAVGIDGQGRIWLVVADGREFAETSSVSTRASVGLSIEELRRVMRHLGARDAINLDGGGSSAMVIRGELVTHPSDPEGERAISDAIVLAPR